jgi:hypothetical protein
VNIGASAPLALRSHSQRGYTVSPGSFPVSPAAVSIGCCIADVVSTRCVSMDGKVSSLPP